MRFKSNLMSRAKVQSHWKPIYLFLSKNDWSGVILNEPPSQLNDLFVETNVKHIHISNTSSSLSIWNNNKLLASDTRQTPTYVTRTTILLLQIFGYLYIVIISFTYIYKPNSISNWFPNDFFFSPDKHKLDGWHSWMDILTAGNNVAFSNVDHVARSNILYNMSMHVWTRLART